MTDYLAREAASAIAANRNRPFFLYLAFNAPHTPLQALRSDYEALSGIENHTLRTYAAMIRALDRGVGTVLEALRANGLEENTLVIFTSDNGGADYVGPARPQQAVPRLEDDVLRGRRAHAVLREVAGAARGRPALPTRRSRTSTSSRRPRARRAPRCRPIAPIDGVDIVKLARGEAQGRPHGAMFWRSGHYRTSSPTTGSSRCPSGPPKTWLFDMNADPTEQHDLSAERPDKVRELSAILARARGADGRRRAGPR